MPRQTDVEHPAQKSLDLVPVAGFPTVDHLKPNPIEMQPLRHRRRITSVMFVFLACVAGCAPPPPPAPVDQNPTDTSQTPATTGEPATPEEDTTIQISFDEIQLPIQADMVFRPLMLSDRVKELDGKKVRISGYMLPDVKTKNITQFVLLKNTECKFGPGGQADHLVNVLMTDGTTAKFRNDPVSVEGVLKINPFQGPDGNTWSLYDLACERVEPYRPRR